LEALKLGAFLRCRTRDLEPDLKSKRQRAGVQEHVIN